MESTAVALDKRPKARMSPTLVWMRTIVERGLTMNDLQILVGRREVNEAEDALAAVHDIPETMADSTLYVSTGAVPSAEDMDRVFTKWHEQVQLSVQTVSPNLVLFTGSTRRSSSRR